MKKKQTKSEPNPEQKELLLQQYGDARGLYVRLCQEVRDEIAHMLEARNPPIQCSSILIRIKDANSFLEKLDRKLYENPLEEMTDLAGVRVVVYRSSDIAGVVRMIRDEFHLHQHVDKTELLGDSDMGYGGTHLVISLGSKYGGARVKDINKLKCEVQVRTVLQDAWATMSHSLVYKPTTSLPQAMLRQFNNLSSVLEVADNGFEHLLSARDKLKQQAISESTSHDFLDLRVSVERIEQYSRQKYKPLRIDRYWQEKLVADLANVPGFARMRDVHLAVERARGAVERYKGERPDLFGTATDHLTKSIGFVSVDFRAVHPFSAVTMEAFDRHGSLVLP